MQLVFELCNPNAVFPCKKVGDVGIDVHVVADDSFTNKHYTLGSLQRHTFSTGLKVNIPDGYAIILKDRSGNASKKGLHVLGGVIDSSYVGEIKVVLFNSSQVAHDIYEGDRICQMVVIDDHDITCVQGIVSKTTHRNELGFGSSGD